MKKKAWYGKYKIKSDKNERKHISNHKQVKFRSRLNWKFNYMLTLKSTSKTRLFEQIRGK